MKKIVLPLILILFGTTILSGCTKDEILNHYNNVVQSAGSIELRKRKISFTPTTLTLNMMKLKNPFVWQARK